MKVVKSITVKIYATSVKYFTSLVTSETHLRATRYICTKLNQQVHGTSVLWMLLISLRKHFTYAPADIHTNGSVAVKLALKRRHFAISSW